MKKGYKLLSSFMLGFAFCTGVASAAEVNIEKAVSSQQTLKQESTVPEYHYSVKVGETQRIQASALFYYFEADPASTGEVTASCALGTTCMQAAVKGIKPGFVILNQYPKYDAKRIISTHYITVYQ